MSLLGFCQWLEKTSWSIALHESIWVYPLVESVHVLTLCLFLGTAVLLDLRLLGLTMRRVPMSEAAGQLVRWMAAGFALMVISGALLFHAIPVRTYLNIFRIKVAMLVLAWRRNTKPRRRRSTTRTAPPIRIDFGVCTI